MSNFSADFQSASQQAALIGPVQTTSSTGGYDLSEQEFLNGNTKWANEKMSVLIDLCKSLRRTKKAVVQIVRFVLLTFFRFFTKEAKYEEFCRLYNIPCKSTFSVFLTADIREKFANFKELYPINQKTAENGFESLTEPNNDTVPVYNSDYFADWSDAELENELECWKQDLERAETENLIS